MTASAAAPARVSQQLGGNADAPDAGGRINGRTIVVRPLGDLSVADELLLPRARGGLIRLQLHLPRGG